MKRRALGFILLAATSAVAAPEEYAIDPMHTYAGFEVLHLGISTQRGRFDRTSGRIELDREALTGRIEVAIDARSISTGSASLDAVLRGEDFFHVEKHPRITFHASRIEFDRGIPRRAPGELTLLGATKPATLAIERFACTRLPFLVRTTCGADASTTLSRSAFGMSSYPAFVADEVRIVIQIEAVRVEPGPDPAPAGG